MSYTRQAIAKTRALYQTMTPADFDEEQAAYARLLVEAWEHASSVVSNGENVALFRNNWAWGIFGTVSEREIRVDIRYLDGNNWLYSGSFTDGCSFYQTGDSSLFTEWLFHHTING